MGNFCIIINEFSMREDTRNITHKTLMFQHFPKKQHIVDVLGLLVLTLNTPSVSSNLYTIIPFHFATYITFS